jgi:hypothetical protein
MNEKVEPRRSNPQTPDPRGDFCTYTVHMDPFYPAKPAGLKYRILNILKIEKASKKLKIKNSIFFLEFFPVKTRSVTEQAPCQTNFGNGLNFTLIPIFPK